MRDFSNKLKTRLKERGMTQGELCEKIDMSMDGLKKAIDHDTLKVRTVEAISEILGVEMDYFLEIKPKSVGPIMRMLEEANTEVQRWKMRAFELEEKFGERNFRRLSRYVNSFFCLQY